MNALVVARFPLLAALILGAGASGGTAFAQSAAVDCWAMHFEIANPEPGARVEPGTYVVQGVAVDGRAEEVSPGIDSVDFFLGSRDAGGIIVGHTVPTSVGALAPNSFQTTVTFPRTAGAQELFGYAHSSVTGEVSVVSVPIAVGVDPNRVGDALSRPPVAECRVGTPVMNEVPPEAQPAEMPAAEPEAAQSETPAPEPSKMFLDVANPSPGDSVHLGALTVDGIAFDRAADGGPGIERVDVFLDDRDAGGIVVGHAALGASSIQPDDPNLAGAGWTAQIMLSPRMTGGHTLFFYALSAATGEEMVVGVPIYVVP